MFQVLDVSARTDKRVYGVLAPYKRTGILLHTTDGTNSLSWLQGGSAAAGKPASADFLVTRLGDIYRLIPKGRFAYHAGVCRWQGTIDDADRVSRLLYGIEIENADRIGQAPTHKQHLAVAGLCLELAHKRLSGHLQVFGHYGVAHPGGRRHDPYQWDWGFMFWLMAHARETITLYGDLDGIGA